MIDNAAVHCDVIAKRQCTKTSMAVAKEKKKLLDIQLRVHLNQRILCFVVIFVQETKRP